MSQVCAGSRHLGKRQTKVLFQTRGNSYRWNFRGSVEFSLHSSKFPGFLNNKENT